VLRVPIPDSPVSLPARRLRRSPVAALGLRIAAALALVLISWAIVLIERGGYTDNLDGHISVVDALYYTTVTLSTTGYGDITPVTTSARLVNALVVTPMRLAFVVLLVGTTLKALTRQSRDEFRLARWRRRMKDHVIVLGYGTKGRNAVRAVELTGTPAAQIVVIDVDPTSVAAAADSGHTAIVGRAADEATLRSALIDRARVVIVALDRDDSAILATLTSRRLAPHVPVVASAREAHNAQLLEQSGAQSVIVSSETAGRLLGLATYSPQTVEVIEDLLSFGEGLDLVQRAATAQELGLHPSSLPIPVLAVLRAGRVVRYTDPEAGPLRAGDVLIYAGS
jgi:voltage-gated potassium channel